MRAAIAGVVVSLAAVGCGAHEYGPEGASPRLGVVMILVENDQWYDMNIFVEGGTGVSQPLGIVPGRTVRQFELSNALFRGDDQIRLIADALGSTARVVSDPVDVGAQSLHWTLERAGGNRILTQ